MTMKIVSQLDDAGYFLGPAEADESPLEPGVFLIPGGAVDAAPPAIAGSQRAKWNGSGFVFEDIPDHEPDTGPNPPTDEEQAAAVRAERNAKLSACDWTVLADAPLTTTEKTAWKAYRQALRDVTAQPTFPQSVEWPVAPA